MNGLVVDDDEMDDQELTDEEIINTVQTSSMSDNDEEEQVYTYCRHQSRRQKNASALVWCCLNSSQTFEQFY